MTLQDLRVSKLASFLERLQEGVNSEPFSLNVHPPNPTSARARATGSAKYSI
jgi:hypothetical protein